MTYIHSSKMRAVLNLILKFQELTTSVNLLDADGKPKAHQIYYRMRQLPDGQVELKGFPIVGMAADEAVTEESGHSVVIAEEAFFKGDYWVGAPKDVYKEFGVGNRSVGKVVWAAAFENEKFYQFAVDESVPLVTMLFSKAQLERLAAPTAAPATMVGSVDESGVLTPAKGTHVDKDNATKSVKPSLVDDLKGAAAAAVAERARETPLRMTYGSEGESSPQARPGLLQVAKRLVGGMSGAGADHPVNNSPTPGHA